jgi:hypothetical protein
MYTANPLGVACLPAAHLKLAHFALNRLEGICDVFEFFAKASNWGDVSDV